MQIALLRRRFNYDFGFMFQMKILDYLLRLINHRLNV